MEGNKLVTLTEPKNINFDLPKNVIIQHHYQPEE